MTPFKHIGKALAFFMVVHLLSSCASYNQQSSDFYNSLAQGNYEKASKNLDRNKLLKKQRNHLLYLLEKGRVEHLLQNFEKSNRYLNEADRLMESKGTSVKDIIAGNLVNPMMERYRGEDFEKYMVHYYKALNYLQLNETEEALVEARRISLRTYLQEDYKKKGQYTEDAFSFLLQGMIYEKAGDANNAFIAYRNAVDLYLKNGQSFYGTRMPEQLKRDLLRLAFINDFADELARYEKLLQLKFNKEDMVEDGELVLFWENGLAPVKKEQNLFFSLSGDGSGNLFFDDQAGLYHIPFDHVNYKSGVVNAFASHTFRVALPKYEQQTPAYNNGKVTIDSNTYLLEAAQNINQLAFSTLKERRIKELSKTLTRQLVKKIAEEAARPDKDEKDNKKKTGLDFLSMGIKLFAIASEKADTRNWQSLPHSIYYTRIPLKKGRNKISILLQHESGRSFKKEFLIVNNGSLQFFNTSTL